MAHTEQTQYVEKIKFHFGDFFSNKKVLEVGSLNINGSIRNLFQNCDYTGIDVGEGPGVDVVCGGQEYNAPDNSFDVVCSTECFEHNPYWLETFKNMIRMCKEDGLVFFTCATEGRAEHGTTRTDVYSSPLTIGIGWDYYKNLNEVDFTTNINFDEQFSSYQFLVNESSFDLYFWGIKKKVDNKKIPVIGVPIVNGVHWMRRLINSVDYPVKELVIFNNNGKGEINQELDEIAKTPHSYIEKITVCHLPANIGCMGAWNMIIKCYMNSPYWIISNHDIAFTPGFLKTMVEKAKDQEVGMVHCSEASWGENLKNEGSFECFLIKDWVVQEYGLFDENLYPAYCDDIDYVLRFKSKPIKRIFSVGVPFLHGEENYSTTGSQTWRTDLSLKDKIDNARIMNECEYINSKWGENWLIKDKQPNKKPFNSFPISYTTYDLNFVRKKHLGF